MTPRNPVDIFTSFGMMCTGKKVMFSLGMKGSYVDMEGLYER